MPDLEISSLEQPAVVWVNSGTSDARSQPILNSPIQIMCRWTWKLTEMMTPDNRAITVDAQIQVAQHIPVDSLMWNGWLKQLQSGGVNGPLLYGPHGLIEVKTFSRSPDVKARVFMQTMGGVRYRGNLPAGVG